MVLVKLSVSCILTAVVFLSDYLQWVDFFSFIDQILCIETTLRRAFK